MCIGKRAQVFYGGEAFPGYVKVAGIHGRPVAAPIQKQNYDHKVDKFGKHW